ncbi:hypothetical protein DH2020_005348 [Rehmannia glutinosa]|uniref:Cytochrome P450 n=1 Tax=Rehmannia glutinosa TaxID=99300 RepID=A0ABR0XFZ6_REHGL
MEHLFVATLSLSILALSFFWFIKAISKSNSKNPPLPPGPRGLPIVGYLPFLGQNLQHPFAGLGQKYGPIYKLRLGTKLHVVISSPSLVKEVVRDQDATFANRDVHVAALVASYDGNDLAWAPNDTQWRGMRKMFVREILSTANLEASYNLRKDEVRRAIRHAGAKIGTRVGISELIFMTELNVIMSMVWGGTLEKEEQERVGAEFWALVSRLNDQIGRPNVSDFFPILAGLDIQGIKKETERLVKSIDGIFDRIVQKRKTKMCGPMDLSEGRKDYLQILLELKEKEDSKMSISDRQFKALLLREIGIKAYLLGPVASPVQIVVMSRPVYSRRS